MVSDGTTVTSRPAEVPAVSVYKPGTSLAYTRLLEDQETRWSYRTRCANLHHQPTDSIATFGTVLPSGNQPNGAG